MNNYTKAKTLLNRLLEHYGKQNWWNSPNPVADWVSMILIQRTTEKNAKLALANLEQANLLSASTLAQLPLTELESFIQPAGFYRQKAVYLQQLAQWFVENETKAHTMNTAELRKQLLKIKGVGAETADVLLLYTFKRPVFVADQYAIRLFERAGLGSYQKYETMRTDWQDLVENMDIETCQEWHAVIDEHGKAYGKSRGGLDESWLFSNL